MIKPHQKPSIAARLKIILHSYRQYIRWTLPIVKAFIKVLPVRFETKQHIVAWASIATTAPGELFRFKTSSTQIIYDIDLTDQLHANLYFFDGSFHTTIFSHLKRLYMPNQDILDIGANIGQNTLEFARLLDTQTSTIAKAKVHAFEPDPDLASQLNHHVILNNFPDLVVVNCAAVGEKNEYQTFHKANPLNSGAGSLGKHENNLQTGKRFQVLVTTIDEYVEKHAIKPGLIKLDIEGAELLALKGAKNTLTKYRPVLAIEVATPLLPPFGFCPDDVFNYLKSHHYQIFEVIDKSPLTEITTHKISEGWHDYICIPKPIN